MPRNRKGQNVGYDRGWGMDRLTMNREHTALNISHFVPIQKSNQIRHSRNNSPPTCGMV